jgi:hypothetical protein
MFNVDRDLIVRMRLRSFRTERMSCCDARERGLETWVYPKGAWLPCSGTLSTGVLATLPIDCTGAR